VHGGVDCRGSLQQKVCFDGTVDVLGASVQWELEDAPLGFSLAALARRERGALYSLSGDTDYRATVQGMWADAVWQIGAGWVGALRLERLVPSNTLVGVGATLVAREAGLDNGGPVRRWTAAVLYAPIPSMQLALEGGSECLAQGCVSHVALRMVWRDAMLLGGGW
jgi:hypothetical protein